MADGSGWQVSVLGSREPPGVFRREGTGQAPGVGRGCRAPLRRRLSPQPPRPCEAYRAEWKLCRSARHFLHHYYVHGERPACEQWRRDLASCRDWEERRSAEAQVRREGAGAALGSALQGPAFPTPSRPRPRDLAENCQGPYPPHASFLLRDGIN